MSMEISSASPLPGTPSVAPGSAPRSDPAVSSSASGASSGPAATAASAAVTGEATSSATQVIRAAARQYAASHSDGLAPLMANLAEAAQSGTLPDSVRDIVDQLLGTQLPTDEVPTADDIRSALQNSGLFTENQFAQQLGAEASSSAATPTDIKSLLLMLRQSLADWAGDVAPNSVEPAASAPSGAAVMAGTAPSVSSAAAAGEVTVPLTPVILPSTVAVGPTDAGESAPAQTAPQASAQNTSTGQFPGSSAYATPGQLLGGAALLAAAQAELESVPASLLQMLSVEADVAESALLAQAAGGAGVGGASAASTVPGATVSGAAQAPSPGGGGANASGISSGTAATAAQTAVRVPAQYAPIQYAPTALQRAAFSSEPDTGLYSALKASAAQPLPSAGGTGGAAASAQGAEIVLSSAASAASAAALPSSDAVSSSALAQAGALKMAGEAPGLAGLTAEDGVSLSAGGLDLPSAGSVLPGRVAGPVSASAGGAAASAGPDDISAGTDASQSSSAAPGRGAEVSARAAAAPVAPASEDDAALAAMIGALTGAAAMAGGLASTSGRLAGMDALAAFLLGRGGDTGAQTLVAQSAAQSGSPTAAQAGAKAADAGAKAGASPLPFKDGPTTAQGAATSSLPQNADAGTVARRLLSDSETALAHQKLLQMASLPDSDQSQRTTSAHWMFEIPLATPQGPAVAQFAIDRDGGENEGDDQDKAAVWRVRFSVDVEPLGPVQAQLALSGGNTWVTLWAERPAALAKLRAGADRLSDALADDAALNAEIAFHPVAVVKRPSSGRFLDHTS